MTTGNLFIAVLLIISVTNPTPMCRAEDGSGLLIEAKVTNLRLPQKITDVTPGELARHLGD
jgi:hypothetical protein